MATAAYPTDCFFFMGCLFGRLLLGKRNLSPLKARPLSHYLKQSGKKKALPNIKIIKHNDAGNCKYTSDGRHEAHSGCMGLTAH